MLQGKPRATLFSLHVPLPVYSKAWGYLRELEGVRQQRDRDVQQWHAWAAQWEQGTAVWALSRTGRCPAQLCVSSQRRAPDLSTLTLHKSRGAAHASSLPGSL
jgi:hypothetical protein